jgi:hypothetical protein
VRFVRWFTAVLIVLMALLVVADRVGAWAAERAVAEQVAQELDEYGVSASPPDITVGGFPFLTQALNGRYESVGVRLRDVQSEGLQLPVLDLTATGVTASITTLRERSGPVDAAEVAGTAVIGYASVAELTELPELSLSPEPDGALGVTVPVEVAGLALTLVGVATVAVDGTVVTVRVQELAVAEAGDLPGAVNALIDQVAQALSVNVELPPLPYDLAVESVRAEASGLAVTVRALDVPLSR